MPFLVSNPFAAGPMSLVVVLAVRRFDSVSHRGPAMVVVMLLIGTVVSLLAELFVLALVEARGAVGMGVSLVAAAVLLEAVVVVVTVAVLMA